jgi:hypothetical protein
MNDQTRSRKKPETPAAQARRVGCEHGADIAADPPHVCPYEPGNTLRRVYMQSLRGARMARANAIKRQMGKKP